jgi:hypothetical protein
VLGDAQGCRHILPLRIDDKQLKKCNKGLSAAPLCKPVTFHTAVCEKHLGASACGASGESAGNFRSHTILSRQEPEDRKVEIDLPPPESMPSRVGTVMMIVMPAIPERHQRDKCCFGLIGVAKRRVPKR